MRRVQVATVKKDRAVEHGKVLTVQLALARTWHDCRY